MTLTVEEYNAVSHYTARTKLDHSFDIQHDPKTNEDFFIDYDENGETHDVQWGLTLIEDAMAYPFEHDVSKEEAVILHKLFNRYGITVRTV